MHKQFMSFVVLLGLLMIVVSGRIDSAIGVNCKSVNLVRANKAVSSIGLIVTTFMLTMMSCLYKCDCSKQLSSGGRLISNINMMYSAVLTVLGIVLVVLGSIIRSEVKKQGCSEAKKSSNAILSLGVLLTDMSGGYIGM